MYKSPKHAPQLLIFSRSWKTAFIGLSQLDDHPAEGALRRHLTDSHTLDLLVRSLAPFPPPTSQTKSSFETKTSAINVPPSNNGQYDIKQIKDDALWLSKETGIDEMVALRITVLEWQMRSSVELIQCTTVDEIAQLNITAGNGGLHALRRSPQSSVRVKSLRSEESAKHSFESLESRRNRILEVYLSERRYLLKTSQYVISRALCQAVHSRSEQSPGKDVGKVDWVREIGDALLADYDVDGISLKLGRNTIVSAVDALQDRATSLEQGSGWFKDQGLREDIEAAWATNQILEMIHIMEMILVLLDSLTKLTRSDATLSWFKFMGRYGFFEVFEPVSPR